MKLTLALTAGLAAAVAQGLLDQRFTATDLLTGAVLAIVLVLLKQMTDLKAQLAQLQERLTHVPTRKEVTDEVGETRHALRNDLTAVQLQVDQALTVIRRHVDLG